MAVQSGRLSNASEGRDVVVNIFLQFKPNGHTVIPLCYLGIGVFLIWGFSVDFTDFFVLGNPGVNPHLCYYVSSVTNGVALIGAALLSRVRPSLLTSRVPCMSGALLGTFGSLVMILAGMLPVDAAQYMAILGAVCAGLAMCLIALVWMEIYSKISPNDVTVRYAASLLAFSLGGAILATIEAPWLSAAIVVALPLLSALCAEKCRKQLEGEDGAAVVETLSDWSFPMKPVLLMAACSMASRIAKVLSRGDVGVLATSGDFLVAVVVLAIAVCGSARLDIRGLYRWALPLCAAGLLLGMCVFPGKAATVAVVSNAGFSCVVTFIMVLFCSMSYRYGINPLWLFGFSRAVRVFAGFAGTAIAQEAVRIGGQAATVVVAGATILLTVCFMLALTENDYRSTWGMTPRKGRHDTEDGAMPTGGDGAVAVTEKDMRTLRLSELRRTYGLTPREIEVTSLLVQGAGIQQLVDELVISSGTARVHLRHIYAKLGVHSKEELIALYNRDVS